MATDEQPAGKDEAEDAPDHSRRRGCSCFTIVLYGLFLLVAVVALGLLYIERKLIQSGLDQLKPTEVADYHRWVEAPLQLPDDAFAVKAEPPAALVKEREAVFRDARLLYERWSAVLDNGRPSLVELMRNGRTLSTEQVVEVTSVTGSFPPLYARARALFTDPEYVANPRTYPVSSTFSYLDFTMMLRALHASALGQVYAGRATDAVETVRVMLLMNRRDEYPGFIYTVTAYDAGSRAVQVAENMERLTSDTIPLEALLKVMNDNRDQLYGLNDTNVYLGDYLPMYRQMLTDGYVTSQTLTPRLLMNYNLNEQEKYLLWLDKTLPGNSSRRPAVQRELAQLRSAPHGYFHIADSVKRSPLKFALRRLERASLESFLVSHWQNSRRFHHSWASSRLNYDTARLSLAQRIAELKGEPVPMKPEEFVPRYLPEFPLDALTSSPITVPMPGASPFAADSSTTSTTADSSEQQ